MISGQMATPLRHALQAMDLEERILNVGLAAGIVGLFLPWLSGEWLGDDYVSYSGFQFYTSFLGIAIFLLYAACLLLTLVPLFGGPQPLRRRMKEIVRMAATALGTALTLAALSVLTNVTFEFSRVEVRLGIYVTLIGGVIAAIEAALRLRELLRQESPDAFHHPDDHAAKREDKRIFEAPLPPPPPPPPLEPEDHHVRL
jgi:hypothetical protein